MKRFVLFSPDYRDDWFYKDGAQLLLKMERFGFDPEILVFDNSFSYSLTEKKIKVTKVDPKKLVWGNLSLFFYLIKNAKAIKEFMTCQISFSSLFLSFVYRKFNPKGFAYLKMDNNHFAREQYDWELIWQNQIPFWKMKSWMMKNIFIKKINLFSIEDGMSKRYFEERYSFLKDQLILLYNGFTPEKESTPTDRAEKQNYLLSVARFGIYEKATDVLLEAFANTKAGHDWKLILCGTVDPAFERQVEDYFKKNPDLKERVIFTGHLNRTELFNFYRQAKVFVLPSRSEGFPNAVSDALFFENAIITTNKVAINDVINGRMGIVIDPDNVAQLQEAMLTLISDPDLTKKYAAEGNKFAVKELDWNLNTKHLYEEMKKRNLQN
jgi:glycosyltransferase involved in cell wall biosynthesis